MLFVRFEKKIEEEGEGNSKGAPIRSYRFLRTESIFLFCKYVTLCGSFPK